MSETLQIHARERLFSLTRPTESYPSLCCGLVHIALLAVKYHVHPSLYTLSIVLVVPAPHSTPYALSPFHTQSHSRPHPGLLDGVTCSKHSHFRSLTLSLALSLTFSLPHPLRRLVHAHSHSLSHSLHQTVAVRLRLITSELLPQLNLTCTCVWSCVSV